MRPHARPRMTPHMTAVGSDSLPSRNLRLRGALPAPEPRAGNPHRASGTVPPRRRPPVPKTQARVADGSLPVIAPPITQLRAPIARLRVPMNDRHWKSTNPSSKARPAATEAADIVVGRVCRVADPVAEAGVDITQRREAAGITQRQGAAGEDTVLPRTLGDPGSKAVGRRQ